NAGLALQRDLVPEHFAGGAIEAVELPAIDLIGRPAAAEAATAAAARPAKAAGPAAAEALTHFLELLLLLVGQDLFEFAVDVFLQCREQLLLLVRQVQLFLEEGGQELT